MLRRLRNSRLSTFFCVSSASRLPLTTALASSSEIHPRVSLAMRRLTIEVPFHDWSRW
jgi:hypothetical protein